MNEQEIVQHMIAFIENKEKQVQNNKLVSVAQSKSDVVKSIMDELERVTSENQ